MVIDLTYRCSMGCSHCMSSCDKNGEEMSLETLIDVCNFIKRYNLDKVTIPNLIISGGEIFEHSHIVEYLDYIFSFFEKSKMFFSITTNGRVLADNQNYQDFMKTAMKKYKKRILVQVTDDERFYPISLTKKQTYYLEKLGAIVDSVPSHSENRNKCLYPQGRALENFDEAYYYTVAPKCTNCRYLALQGICTINELVDRLSIGMKFCTPSISPKGEIKLGESRLCPSVATIYQTEKEIIECIRNCKCTQCSYPIKQLMNTNIIAYSKVFGREK